MSLAQFKFHHTFSHVGTDIFEPKGKQAEELWQFMGWSNPSISEYRFDKLYDWLTSLGHEVLIEEDRFDC